MKKFFNIICIGMVGGLLVSCDKPVRSVEWYKQHEAEREIMLSKCKADPKLIKKDQNCRNAGDAQALSGHYTKSPAKSWGIEGPREGNK